MNRNVAVKRIRTDMMIRWRLAIVKNVRCSVEGERWVGRGKLSSYESWFEGTQSCSEGPCAKTLERENTLRYGKVSLIPSTSTGRRRS